MRALVVYESMFGNTHLIAEAIATGLDRSGSHVIKPAHAVSFEDVEAADIVVVGGPTHAWSMARASTRKGATDDSAKHPEHALEPDAAEPGLREWFRQLAEQRGRYAAAFDTRLDKPKLLTGSAARSITRELDDHGFQTLGEPSSFVVSGMDGPLVAGEVERACAWGELLGRLVEQHQADGIVASSHRPG